MAAWWPRACMLVPLCAASAHWEEWWNHMESELSFALPDPLVWNNLQFCTWWPNRSLGLRLISLTISRQTLKKWHMRDDRIYQALMAGNLDSIECAVKNWCFWHRGFLFGATFLDIAFRMLVFSWSDSASHKPHCHWWKWSAVGRQQVIYSDMHTASRGSDSFSVQRMACTLQYDDYLFHSFSSSKDLPICILFYSGPNVHNVILQRKALDPFKTYAETQASKRYATS